MTTPGVGIYGRVPPGQVDTEALAALLRRKRAELDELSAAAARAVPTVYAVDEIAEVLFDVPEQGAVEHTPGPAATRPAWARPALQPGEQVRVLSLPRGARGDCADCLNRQREAHRRGVPASIRRPVAVRVVTAQGEQLLCRPCLADRGATPGRPPC